LKGQRHPTLKSVEVKEYDSAVEYAFVLTMFMCLFPGFREFKLKHRLLQQDDENGSDFKLEKLRLFVEIETNSKLIK
jgi:hypothetical protein